MNLTFAGRSLRGYSRLGIDGCKHSAFLAAASIQYWSVGGRPARFARRVPVPLHVAKQNARDRPIERAIARAAERAGHRPHAESERRSVDAGRGQRQDAEHDRGHRRRLGVKQRADHRRVREHDVGWELTDHVAQIAQLPGRAVDEDMLHVELELRDARQRAAPFEVLVDRGVVVVARVLEAHERRAALLDLRAVLRARAPAHRVTACKQRANDRDERIDVPQHGHGGD
jgi:hypothetical protein